MAVLVSGALGFLGSRLVERLAAEGRDVIAVARRPAPAGVESNPMVRWIVQDIARDGLSLTGMGDIEGVIHMAGATLGAGKDESLFLQANEQTLVRLLQSVADRTDKVIFASSQVVYGDACDLGVTEDFPLHPEGSAYACSKLNSENWLRCFQKQQGGQYLALRFCGFMDGGGIIDYIIDKALTGEPIELYSGGKVRRDYLLSSDGVDALMAALRFLGEPGFLPVNIGSGQVFSAYEMATLICAELRSKSKIELHTTSAPQGDFVFCIDRARRLLDFQPSNFGDAIKFCLSTRQRQALGQVKNAKN